jgi:hypothetical protein
LIFLVFGLLFAPWSFNPIVGDLLGLDYFARRFVWALPGVLIGGIVLANLDVRPALGLLTVAALTLGLGLSGPDRSSTASRFYFFDGVVDVRDAPNVWPWKAGIDPNLRRTAVAVARDTPRHGRFLAPPTIEQIVTAIQIDKYPVYAREHYLLAIGHAPSVPVDFHTRERLLLSRGMTRMSPSVSSDRWREALRRVRVDTVCMDRNTAPGLRRVVTDTYFARGSAGACDVWTRRAG